ncbi:hypothetical protein P5G50_00225 [Leifsonia sp. F6_8S_P_1B]|uniref:SLATT domain-containing protein n=1 Tax=Leifsonia williamsii TaxID=3035919 RepID=A0ABT8K635_9MICO|nr:DUF6611 family protein [Leifsonia williamsii]MDN4612859.1 hypothetical protein [Leifsonia williamsii]
MRELLRRLTEGSLRWGAVEHAPASPTVWRRITVTVYPPGVTTAERRLLHAGRWWPFAGAVIGVFGMAVAADHVPPVLAGFLAVACYIASCWALHRRTAGLRARSRTVTAVFYRTAYEDAVYGDPVRVREVIGRFRELEDRRAAGDLDPVGYEREWGLLYDSVPEQESLRRVPR